MQTCPPYRILFVCLGNICRSPLAEGVFGEVARAAGREAEFTIDSAGTGGWHVGSGPDPRAVAIAGEYGIDIAGQRCRRVMVTDFTDFDLVLAMDLSNLADLNAVAPESHRNKIHLFLDYATGSGAEVPDPYHGGTQGFRDVYRTIRTASEALIGRLGAGRAALSSGQASSTT